MIVAENAPYLDVRIFIVHVFHCSLSPFCECNDNSKGHELAASLIKASLDVTLITDSAIFTIISRVNTVIIGTNSIFANGG